MLLLLAVYFEYIYMYFLLLYVARNVDYTTVNDYVVFAFGEYMKNITIPILMDSETEEVEIFNVELTTDCCADVIIGQVQVNITEADSDGM